MAVSSPFPLCTVSTSWLLARAVSFIMFHTFLQGSCPVSNYFFGTRHDYSHADSEAMRARSCTSSAQTDYKHFDVLRMANVMDGTLGGAALQTKINLRPRQRQGHPLNISDQQSCKEGHCLNSHWGIWTQSICIHARKRRTRRFKTGCINVDFDVCK